MLLDYAKTSVLLKKHGIKLARGFLCASEGELLEKSRLLKKPYVLKVVGPQVMHKTEKKLIALDLHSVDQLQQAFWRLKLNAKGLRDVKFLLQSELRGVELIVGGKEDAVFGETILFGSGGVTVELFKDFSLRLAPLTKRDALEMINETQAKAYFTENGFRGRKANLDKIVALLLRTSNLLAKEKKVAEVDFNPVIVDEGEAFVADAKVMIH